KAVGRVPECWAPFKRIICDDISEFESSNPSHAVGSLWRVYLRAAPFALTGAHVGRKGLPALWNGAGLLGLQMREQCLLVAVAEGRGVKLAGLAVENMLGQREHVRRNGEVGQVAEVILGLAHLIGVAQRGAEKPLVVWLKRDHPLALGEH